MEFILSVFLVWKKWVYSGDNEGVGIQVVHRPFSFHGTSGIPKFEGVSSLYISTYAAAYILGYPVNILP
jgi:hypothetical protein